MNTYIKEKTKIKETMDFSIYSPMFMNVWNDIKKNISLLKWAISISNNNYDNVLNCSDICEKILIYNESIDKSIYRKLINVIFSNEKVARKVIDGQEKKAYSYLLMALYNNDIKLTEDQKDFAVIEALNKVGTVTYYEIKEARKENFFNDKDRGDIDKERIKIDRRRNILYKNHGDGIFDIRYSILRNNNWSREEKEELIYSFYADDDYYFLVLKLLELEIVRDEKYLDIDNIYEYDIKYLEDKYGIWRAKEILDEIKICKLMHELRPLENDEIKSNQKKLELKKM